MRQHGANVFELACQYGFPLQDIRDFSSNISPYGPPKKAMTQLKNNLHLVTTYPDPSYQALTQSITEYIGVDARQIVLSSGTTPLLKEAIQLLHPRHALLLEPCYSEYAYELKRLGISISIFPLKAENNFEIDVEALISLLKEQKIDFLVFANPNNPTGSIVTREAIKKILIETSTFILVDETYNEFTDPSLYSAIELVHSFEQLLVVRGVSKFYACPGIRLGYGVTGNYSLLKCLKANSTLWEINIFADVMGQSLYSDRAYQMETREKTAEERRYMMERLRRLKGLRVFPSAGNFILCRLENGYKAEELREHLLKEALVIRDCSSFEHLTASDFRFCLLSHADNVKLADAIEGFLLAKDNKV